MHILVVKTSSLGDIIHSYPALDCLLQMFPQAQIDWVVEKPFADLVRAHPFVDRVFVVETKRWRKTLIHRQTRKEIKAFRRELKQKRYDVLFDFQGNMKSALVTLAARAKVKVGFGRKTVTEWPNLLVTNKRFDAKERVNIRDRALSLVEAYFGEKKEPGEPISLRIGGEEEALISSFCSSLQGPTMMICPGSAWESKRLSEEAFVSFAREAIERGKMSVIWVWGSEKEKAFAEKMEALFPKKSVVAPRFSVAGLQGLMNLVDVVVAMDSFALHLCGTTTTPSFGVFGPTKGSYYQSRGSLHAVFQGACPFGQEFSVYCPKKRKCPAPCIKEIEGGQLYQAFERWFYSIQPPPKTRSPS